jgi:ABC-type molybdate transport system substrate-binding protein
MRSLLVALALSAVMVPRPGGAAESVRLHAAGSLRAALTEIAQAFEAREGARVEGKFGPSGMLREEIAKGAPAEVFASANMEHPLSLSRDGKAGPVVLFARNRLCALARPDFAVDPANLVDRMLDPQVKLGTSTPKADPSGDYAWEVFRKIERQRPGSFAALDSRALKLTGGAASPAPPSGRTIYGLIVERGDADLFLTYCTNARVAADEVAGARVLQLPDDLAVGADYGLTVVKDASPAAYRLALFILSPDGQGILARHGFSAPTLPAPEDRS